MAVRARLSSPRARPAARSTSSAPTSRSADVSCPASTLAPRSRRHVPKLSIQACTAKR